MSFWTDGCDALGGRLERRDRDDIFDEESDVSSIETEWDVWMDVPGDWYFQK